MRSLVVIAIALGMAPFAGAQEPRSQPSSPPPAPEAIDAGKLGVDLNKIQKGLAEAAEEERLSADGLRIDYRVQVFGSAPAPDFFESFNPVTGQVPWGGPTHRDVLDVLTPVEFRAPAANFSALAFWAIQKLSERNDRQRCEAELARYRADVMAGMSVAAPSCAR